MTEGRLDAGDEQHGEQQPPALAGHLQSKWLGVTLQSISDGVIATNAEGIVRFMNPVAESLTGWRADEAQGQPLEAVFKILNEDTRGPLESPTAQAMREAKTVGLRSLLIVNDGIERPVRGSAAPICDDRGRIAGAVLTFRDISEQHRAEHQRQAALDYANNIIATLRHPFLVLDGKLRVKSANRSFYESFQVAPEATEGQRVYDLGNGQWNIPGLTQLLEEVLPENTAFEGFEVEHTFPTIGPRFMVLNARRIHRLDSDTDLILLGIEDITERRRLEEQRREIETRFTLLVKNISDHAIFALDQDGYIVSWNVEAERILGYSEAEAVGQHFSIIFTAEDIEQGLPEEELRLAKEIGRAEDERWHRRKNGELFWALGIVTPMYDLAGKPTGYSKILRDITERKQMEQELRDADRRKDEFLAMLSHELRNPLAPILVAVELIGGGGQ